jgi:hypothetical protein
MWSTHCRSWHRSFGQGFPTMIPESSLGMKPPKKEDRRQLAVYFDFMVRTSQLRKVESTHFEMGVR